MTSSLMAKKQVARRPLSAWVEQSIHGPWQTAATTLPCSAMVLTRRIIGGQRRMWSGA